VVATLVIGGYMALGFAFRLGAEGYLLLGIPITISFQILVVRRPLRSLWLRQAPPLTFTSRSMVAIVGMAIAPAVAAASGVRDGDPALVGWALAGMVGAVGAVYALRAMDRDAVRSTIRTTLITGAVLVGIMVAYRLATGGFNGNLAGAVTTAVISLATYLPVVFVMEEVLFRGLIDPYLHGSTPGPDRASALYGSALWGLWHLPVAFLALGALTIPYLVIVHTTMGYFLVTAWRRTGNLAASGVSHAVIDALRNAVAVF
jgi:membrane protease YdiL (CAAX protease family)